MHRPLDSFRDPSVAREGGVDDGKAHAVEITREGGGEGEDDEVGGWPSHGLKICRARRLVQATRRRNRWAKTCDDAASS